MELLDAASPLLEGALIIHALLFTTHAPRTQRTRHTRRHGDEHRRGGGVRRRGGGGHGRRLPAQGVCLIVFVFFLGVFVRGLGKAVEVAVMVGRRPRKVVRVVFVAVSERFRIRIVQLNTRPKTRSYKPHSNRQAGMERKDVMGKNVAIYAAQAAALEARAAKGVKARARRVLGEGRVAGRRRRRRQQRRGRPPCESAGSALASAKHAKTRTNTHKLHTHTTHTHTQPRRSWSSPTPPTPTRSCCGSTRRRSPPRT